MDGWKIDERIDGWDGMGWGSSHKMMDVLLAG